MDPVPSKSTEFISLMLNQTVSFTQVLDSNDSGGLSSLEFCAAMKKLVSVLYAGMSVSYLR